MTQPSPQEAREMLADIDQVAKKMRNSLAAGDLAPNLMLWGVVWAIGFVLSYFLPTRTGTIWLWLIPAGLLMSMTFGYRNARRRLVNSESDRKLGLQMFSFWMTIFAFATAMVYVLHPQDGRDFCAIFVLFSMMAYVIMGIWLKSVPLAIVGLLVSAATIGGRLMLEPQPFLIWMAVFGGGALFFAGLYIQLRWR